MTPTVTLTDEDWTRAKQRLDDIVEQKRRLADLPGVDIYLVMFTPNRILRRWNRGERTQELYDAMLEVS